MATAKKEKFEKQYNYDDRQKVKGLKKIHPWIPDTPEADAKAKAYCERLRKAHAKKACK